MDAALQLIEDTGIALRREMVERGVRDRDLREAVRHGVLIRIRQGAYTTPARWTATDDVGRHRMLCTSVSRLMGDTVALTHTSSLVMQDVPVWGADLTRVHVTRLDHGSGRHEAGVVHHKGAVESRELVRTSAGFLATPPARAIFEHASINTIESGLVSFDAALHSELVTASQVAQQFELMERWPGTQRLQLVVRLTDGRAESPGETRSRYLCWRHGLPAPVLQFEVYDTAGNLIGRTDFAWPEHRLLGEFDGRLKYGRSLGPGQTPSDAVFREKRREDLLREITQWAFVRLIWSDLRDGAYTAHRIRQLMRRAA